MAMIQQLIEVELSDNHHRTRAEFEQMVRGLLTEYARRDDLVRLRHDVAALRKEVKDLRREVLEVNRGEKETAFQR